MWICAGLETTLSWASYKSENIVLILVASDYLEELLNCPDPFKKFLSKCVNSVFNTYSISFANTEVFLLFSPYPLSPGVFPQELNLSLTEVLSLPVWRGIEKNCVPVRLMWAQSLLIIAQRVTMMRSGATWAGDELSHEVCLLHQP